MKYEAIKYFMIMGKDKSSLFNRIFVQFKHLSEVLVLYFKGKRTLLQKEREKEKKRGKRTKNINVSVLQRSKRKPWTWAKLKLISKIAHQGV